MSPKIPIVLEALFVMDRISNSLVVAAGFVRHSAVVCWCGTLVLPIADAAAEVINVSDSSSFQAALDNATEGHEIVLAPGAYPGRFTANGINGVTVRSADPNNRAVINAAGKGEGLKLSSITNVTISDLIIENASSIAMNIDDGGHVAPTENISLSNIAIRNGGGDGIKLTGVVGFHVDRAHIRGWGGNYTAVNMIGTQNGVVERSYFENTMPANGAGVQTKGGSANVVIRANRFVSANERAIQIGGTTGLSLFRPQPPGNVEASDIIAEGNVILYVGKIGGIRSAASFINVGDGIFRNNVAFRPSRYFFRILKENNNVGFIDTQNGTIVDNIFLWNDNDLIETINDGSQTLPNTFTFERNQWFNMTNPNESHPTLPVAEIDGIYGVDPQVDLQGITPWDFSWGKWLVNTSNLVDSVPLDPNESFLLATPSEGATLDIGAENPLLGSWTLAPVALGDFTVQPFSYAVLLRAGDESVLGDYNSDGTIDSLDYDLWKSTFGSGTLLSADGNDDGIIDAADYTIWRDALESQPFESPVSIPEPTSATLWCCALFSWIGAAASLRVPIIRILK